MNVLELSGVCSSGGYGGIGEYSGGRRCSAGMVTVCSVEWRHANGGVVRVVVSKLGHWEERVPVFLLV